MKRLNLNWVTKGLMDFEYKQFILLAYLQEVSKEFRQNKLYPSLADLISQYQNLMSIRDNQQFVREQFPKNISGLDFEQFKLRYEELIEDKGIMQEIEKIISFAIPRIEDHIKDGKEIYEFVEDRIKIRPIGLVPLNLEAGYLMLKRDLKSDTRVYEYEITIFENASEKYRGIKVDYVTSYPKSITQTFESIKTELVSTHQKFANPATYVIESSLTFPFTETFLPIAKRSLVRYITDQSKER